MDIKTFTNESGIYSIKNIENGKIYIGSTVNFRQRITTHLTTLRRNIHKNKKLQNSWNKHGELSFEITVIETVRDKSSLLTREQYWIDKCCSVEHGYNINPLACSSRGRPYTDEHKAKTSAATKACWKNQEYKDRISISRKLMWESTEHREKIAKNRTLISKTSEYKAKIGAASKALWKNPEYRNNLIQKRILLWESPEYREKIAEKRAIFMSSPSYKEGHSNRQKVIGLYSRISGFPYRTAKYLDAMKYLLDRDLIDDQGRIKEMQQLQDK
jgi:group I intron endonuclease